MPAALHTARMATRCTPDRRTTFSAAVSIAAIVASERRLRRRRRDGWEVGAGAVARLRDLRATVVGFDVSPVGLDLARFFVTGAFIESLLPCARSATSPAEILQHFMVHVQQPTARD